MRWLAAAIVVSALALPAQAAQPTADAVAAAWRDIQSLPPADQLYTRYLWISDPDPKLRWRTWNACAGQINGLSLSRRIVSPPLILADGGLRDFRAMAPEEWGQLVLMRVDLRAYRQTAAQWDKLGHPDVEPLFHAWTKPEAEWVRGMAPQLIEPLGAKPDEWKQYREAAIGLITATGNSPTPIVEARNFIWQVVIDFDRHAGYSSWLGIVDQKSYEKLVRLQRGITPLREAVSKSGVSQQPRAIDRFGRGDGVWYTYDQVKQRGQYNRNPILQMDRNKFVFDGIEAFGRMDNDWWAVAAFDNKGAVLQSAPDGIGFNHYSVSNNGKIDALACFVCHDREAGNGGLKPFSPYFRNLYSEPGPIALPLLLKTDFRIAEEYLTPLEAYALADRQAYAAAVFQACGVTPQAWVRNLYDTFHDWDKPVSLEQAAWEHGVPVQQFVAGLNVAAAKWGRLDNVNANWIKPDAQRQLMGRDQVTETYGLAELALRNLPAWSAETKKQLIPWKAVKP